MESFDNRFTSQVDFNYGIQRFAIPIDVVYNLQDFCMLWEKILTHFWNSSEY